MNQPLLTGALAREAEEQLRAAANDPEHADLIDAAKVDQQSADQLNEAGVFGAVGLSGTEDGADLQRFVASEAFDGVQATLELLQPGEIPIKVIAESLLLSGLATGFRAGLIAAERAADNDRPAS